MAYYPTPPAERFAYDTDGSLVTTRLNTPIATLMTLGDMGRMNNEYKGLMLGSDTNYDIPEVNDVDFSGEITIVFPDVRTVTHFYWSQMAAYYAESNQWRAPTHIQVSDNTTNGQDGTWSQVASNIDWRFGRRDVSPKWREDIVALSEPAENIQGIRVAIPRYKDSGGGQHFDFGLRIFHIWGYHATSGKLVLWEPDVDENGLTIESPEVLPVGAFDFGDVAQSSQSSRKFTVKNTHSTLTANSVQLGLTTPYDTTPASLGAYELSSDNSSWGSVLNLGSIAPGARSDDLWLRKTTQALAVPQLSAFRVKAVAGGWS